MKATSLALFAAVDVVIGVPLGAGPQQSQPPPAFRAATDLVEVDLMVQDRTGRFVTDLTAEDFAVQDDGRPQRVEAFYRVESNARVGAAGAERLGEAPNPAAASRSPRVFVVVFDDEHLTPGGFKRVQAAALALFTKQFQPGDLGGVIANGQMAGKHLMTGREELLKAVRAAKPNAKSNSRLMDERQWPQMSEVEAVRIKLNDDGDVHAAIFRQACQEDPDICRKAPGYIDSVIDTKAADLSSGARIRSLQTLQTIITLMNGLARFDGRKTVLLLSEGFLTDESWPLVKDAVGLAARANARIYTLDARGLDRGLRSGQDVNPGADDALARLLAQFDWGSDAVNSLAVDTGGFVVRNTNAFDKAIDLIGADAGNYYVLGYRPEAAPDGKFHRISVAVNRSGLALRARRGYVATSRATPLTPTVDATRPSTSSTTSSEPSAELANSARGSTLRQAQDSGRATLPAPTDPARGEPVEPRAASPGIRLRPDALRHVETLASDRSTDEQATAGWQAYQRGDLESARGSLGAAAAAPSARPWVHYALGQAEYGLRDYDGAIASWERVRGAVPEFEPVYFDLVDGYLQTKEYDKAIRLLRGAAERWPRDVEIFNALGVVQVARGALDDGVKSFEQAVRIAPYEATSYFNLGKAFELRYSKSRRYVQLTRTWVANESDRTNAIANYHRYLELGGPFENSAREGLGRLNWVTAAKQ